MQISALALIITSLGFFVVLIAALIYLVTYKNAINKRLNSGEIYNEPPKKPMMSPLKLTAILFCIYFGVVIILVIASAISGMVNGRNTTEISRSVVLPIVDSCNADETSGTIYESFTADGDIAGYERRESTDGDFRFVYFLRSAEWDCGEIFPEFIIYAEYTGDGSGFLAGYEMSAMNSDGGIGNSCCDSKANGTWFSGNLESEDTVLSIKYMIFTDEGSKSAMSDGDGEYAKYAEKVGEFRISGENLANVGDEEG